MDKDGNILDVKSMGFNQADRMALLKLLMTDEKKLDNLTIQDWFKETPHIFETNFLVYVADHLCIPEVQQPV